MSQVDWAARMSAMRDRDLLEIVGASDHRDFHPQAIDAALAEMDRRNLGEAAINELYSEAFQDATALAIRAEKPLGILGWVLSLAAGPTIFPVFLAAYLADGKGYRQKAVHMVAAVMASWCVMAILWIMFA